MGRGRIEDEGRSVESGKVSASGSGPDAVEVHRAGGTMTKNGPGCGAADPTFPPPVPASPKATPQAHPGSASLGKTCAAPPETGW
jgi:hypothetical protein